MKSRSRKRTSKASSNEDLSFAQDKNEDILEALSSLSSETKSEAAPAAQRMLRYLEKSS